MSVTLQRYPFSLAAGAVMVLAVSGTQFVVTAATGALSVDLDTGSEFRGLLAGQGYKGAPFGQLVITNTSGAQNDGYIVVSDDDYIDRRITGAVTFAPLGADFANAQKTVTNASGQLLAANAARKYLLIQNNGSGDVFVRLDGGVATSATGVKLLAGGGSLELSTVVPSAAITAIGSIASNPDVLAVEG